MIVTVLDVLTVLLLCLAGVISGGVFYWLGYDAACIDHDCKCKLCDGPGHFASMLGNAWCASRAAAKAVSESFIRFYHHGGKT